MSVTLHDFEPLKETQEYIPEKKFFCVIKSLGIQQEKIRFEGHTLKIVYNTKTF